MVGRQAVAVMGGGTQVGDELEVKGPIPKFPYKANMKKKIGEPRHGCKGGVPRE